MRNALLIDPIVRPTPPEGELSLAQAEERAKIIPQMIAAAKRKVVLLGAPLIGVTFDQNRQGRIVQQLPGALGLRRLESCPAASRRLRIQAAPRLIASPGRMRALLEG